MPFQLCRQPPLGLAEVPVPTEIPQAGVKIALGDTGALSAQEVRGQDVYLNKGRCVACHVIEQNQAQFTDNRFQNIGIDFKLLPDREAETAAAALKSKCEGANVDVTCWMNEFMTVSNQGEKLFHGGLNSNTTVSCDQCHPNATNIHPETSPSFQEQQGRVAERREMVNWCIMNPQESDPLTAAAPQMTALSACSRFERRGVPLAPGKH